MSKPEEFVKTTWRLPKGLVKQLKQYALDHDTTVTTVATQAFKEFLKREK